MRLKGGERITECYLLRLGLVVDIFYHMDYILFCVSMGVGLLVTMLKALSVDKHMAILIGLVVWTPSLIHYSYVVESFDVLSSLTHVLILTIANIPLLLIWVKILVWWYQLTEDCSSALFLPQPPSIPWINLVSKTTIFKIIGFSFYVVILTFLLMKYVLVEFTIINLGWALFMVSVITISFFIPMWFPIN